MSPEEILKRKTEKVYLQIMSKYSAEVLTPEIIRRNAERYNGVFTSLVLAGGEGASILEVLAVRNAWRRVADEKGYIIDFSGRVATITAKEGKANGG